MANNLGNFLAGFCVGFFMMFPLWFMPNWAGYIWSIFVISIWGTVEMTFKD